MLSIPSQTRVLLKSRVKAKRAQALMTIHLYFTTLNREESVSDDKSCEGDLTASYKVTWCKWRCCLCVCVCSSCWRWTQSTVSPVCLTCRHLPTSLTSTGMLLMKRRWRLDLSPMSVHIFTRTHISTHAEMFRETFDICLLLFSSYLLTST